MPFLPLERSIEGTLDDRVTGPAACVKPGIAGAACCASPANDCGWTCASAASRSARCAACLMFATLTRIFVR